MKFTSLIFSVFVIMFTGCSEQQGSLVEDYLSCVSDKDIEGMKDKLSVEDARVLDDSVKGCLNQMANNKSKKVKIRQYIDSAGYMSRNKNMKMLYTQVNLKRRGKDYTDKFPEPDELVETITKDMPEEGKGFVTLLVELGEDDSKDKNYYDELSTKWFNEYYTDKSFCEMQTVKPLMYSEINIIEVKEKSADKVEVRYEIVKEDGSSLKRSMSVEKVNGDWAIAGLPYFNSARFW